MKQTKLTNRSVDLNAALILFASLPPAPRRFGAPGLTLVAYRTTGRDLAVHLFADYYDADGNNLQRQCAVCNVPAGGLLYQWLPRLCLKLRKGLKAPDLTLGHWYAVETTAKGTEYTLIIPEG